MVTETSGKGSSNHAPCLAGGMLHALLRGDNLLDTVHRNLMTKRQADQFFGKNSWGRPVWELMPQRPADAAAVRNATRTYLGRLVPLTRAIWLADDCRSLILANGLEYGSYAGWWREPSATIVTRTLKRPARACRVAGFRREGRVARVARPDRQGRRPESTAAQLRCRTSLSEEAFDLWVGGLVANKAKPVDTTESVFHVPAAMLGEPSQMAYEKGVRQAENVEFRVRRAVSVYHKELGDDLDRPEMKNRRQQIQNNAAAQFWTDVESAVPRLLEVAADPGSLGLNAEWHKTAWGQSVWRAARAAYEQRLPARDAAPDSRICAGAESIVRRTRRATDIGRNRRGG